MSKLTEYSKGAEFMNISLEVDGKNYSFNLDLQLRIEETRLDRDITEQPRAYAFLCMLRNKVKTQIKQKMKHLEQQRAIKYNKMAEDPKAKVTDINNKLKASGQLRMHQNEIDDLDNLKSVLDIAVTSFEMRKDLLQTLSSNLRKENKN